MNCTRRHMVLGALLLTALWHQCLAKAGPEAEEWRRWLVQHLATGPATAVAKARKQFPDAALQLAVVADWIAQDEAAGPAGLRGEAVKAAVDELDRSGDSLRSQYAELVAQRVPSTDPRWAHLYLTACLKRRSARLAPHRRKISRVIFTKHYDLGGSHYAYTEGQCDAQAERHFQPGASLCLLELDRPFGSLRTLIDDPSGVIRDPDVSYDGKRVLFAWKKSLDHDDYHLYELDMASGRLRQLTFGLGFADYEPAYLPNGHIIFNSTRCVQTVDCWWTEVSNLFTCDGDGRFLRRLSFDQVHTNYPTVTSDGRVIYTRWDYNDRGQIFPQGLFEMNPDGTGQRELYGNNSWFPTSILHARGIPGTHKVVGIFSGHHTRQTGWLGILDPARGRQENSGAQLIAPVRRTDAVRIDKYGQTGDQFQYPYPLSGRAFLVAFKPAGSPRRRPFAIYLMYADGRRELLACDADISCNQPVPLAPRPVPPVRSSPVDYRRSAGTFYVQNVYVGEGLRGVAPGTIKRLRVVALEFRAAGVGSNYNHGPAGRALISTPVSIEGTWDVKLVLGTARVYDDGSACFTVPARTPVYFQALDAKGHAVQTMRSWVTVQPGEAISCVGCHENKNAAPPLGPVTRAMRAGPQELTPWYGPPRGFSFKREIQPILDRHCVRCHYVEPEAESVSAGHRSKPPPPAAFSLKGTERFDPKSLRYWSDAYLALANRRYVNWVNIQSGPPVLPPYHAGAARSRLIALLEQGHYGVKLRPDELDRIATWIDLLVPYCGDYRDGLQGEHLAKYQRFLDKRRKWEQQEALNIAAYLRHQLEPDRRPKPQP